VTVHRGEIEVLIDASAIARRVRELAAAIRAEYEGRDLLLIGVLKGALYFMVDLTRELERDHAIDFMAVSSYGGSTASSGVVRILKDLDQSIEDKHVLIVEDIVDTGLTLAHLRELLLTRGPATLRICALLDKRDARQVDVPLDLVGFTIPSRFVVGYGLDFSERFRDLRFIGSLPERAISVQDLREPPPAVDILGVTIAESKEA